MTMPMPDTPAFRRLARAEQAYAEAITRALDAQADIAASLLEDAARQLNAYSDLAEIVYGDHTTETAK